MSATRRSFIRVVRGGASAVLLAVGVAVATGSCGGRPEEAQRTERPALAAEAGARVAGEWAVLHGDAASTRSSPLAQLHAGNVANLTRVWTRSLGRFAAEVDELQATPLMAEGMMFVAAVDHVSALEPETGTEKWRHRTSPRQAPRRGLAYWPGHREHAPRLFFNSSGRLIALHAESGRRIPSFGSRGEVDAGLAPDAVPLVHGDLVIVPSDRPTPSVRAYDLFTGAARWTLEATAELLRDTPLAAAVTAVRPGYSMALDADRAVLYSAWTAGAAGRADGRAMEHVVLALDAHTGSVRWHFAPPGPVVPPAGADGAVPARSGGRAAAPVVFDLLLAGQRMPALAVAGTRAPLHILDRRSGAPLVSIEEPRGLCGGAGWGGAAFDAALGYLFFVSAVDATGQGEAAGQPAPVSSCAAPGAELVAVHVGSGDVAWRVALGPQGPTGEGASSVPRSAGGPIVTGGGLVFVGATDDGRLRALDARTGTELWAGVLDARARAHPMTYQGRDGKQYVAITASGTAASAERQEPTLIAFALP